MTLATRSREETARIEPRGPAMPETKEARPVDRFAPAAILVLAMWCGLVTGFLDLGFLVFKRRFIDHDLVRLGDGYPWIIPTGVALLVLLPGATLAAVARLRRQGIRLGIAVGVPAFIGLLDVSTKFPLEFWSSSLLSAGLAVQTVRLVRRRPDAIVRVARLTSPFFAGLVLLIALKTSGLRAWSEHRAAASLPPPPTAAPNVLLIVWDTVRAQSVGLYGYGRRTTPNLDRLAQEGAWFRHAFSTSSWTLPSHASLFTGRWPHELSAGWKTPLDLEEPTLAEELQSLGYDTAGFVANLDFLGRETGVARGFGHYEDYPLTAREVFTRYVGLGRKLDHFSVAMLVDKVLWRRGPSTARPLVPISREHSKRAADVDREFLEWLSWQRARGRPFFAFLNYNEAHTPYEVPDDSLQGFGARPTSWHERLVMQKWNTLDKSKLSVRDVQMAHDLYDDSIAYLDRRLGSLVDELKRRQLFDDTIVIVTADHGEHLGDHGLFFHGCSLYRQLVQVPLVIVSPKRVPAGRVIAEPASLRDVPTTVLDLVGLAAEVKFPGRSLARFWGPRDAEAASSPAFEPVLMETERPEVFANHGREPVAKGPMKALVAGGMHYIRLGDGSEELYALGADPEENTNVAGLPQAAPSLAGFRGALQAIMRGGTQSARGGSTTSTRQ
jgi:arylsulfatase A-like enzyme